MDRFYDAVQRWTEKKLTHRKAYKQYMKDHRSLKLEILDTLDAIVFAVFWVFIINQFLFQLFVIPSPSMENTINVGNRVVVSKLTYGIELYPYGPKILDGHQPDRDDIITFYNPQLESKGTGFSILSKVIYMATFGLMNIDVDEDGNPSEWLFVKRTAGKSGDTMTFRYGDAYIRPSGTTSYVKESDFRAANGLSTAPHTTSLKETYVAYDASGRLNGIAEAHVTSTPNHLLNDYKTRDPEAWFTDEYWFDKMVYEGTRMADPTDATARSNWMKKVLGVYVPENYILPLGDNRDNSGDGRYFGPVSVKSVTGFVVNIFWPLSRLRSFLQK